MADVELVPGRLRRRAGAVLAALVASTVALAWLRAQPTSTAVADALRRFDNKALRRTIGNTADVLDPANDLLGVVGSFWFIVPVTLLASRLAWFRWRRATTAAVPLASAGLAGGLADFVLKPVTASTFPSGTIAVVTAIGTTSLALLFAHNQRIPWGSIAILGCTLTAVATALLLTAYHSASDLAGGLMLGLCATLVAVMTHDAAMRKRP